MSDNFRMDRREFDETLKKCVVASSRTIAEVVNSRAFFVSKRARDMTPIGDRSTIETALGVSSYKLNYTKKGDRLKKRSKGGAIFEGGGVYALVNYWQKKKGKPAFSRSEIETEANKFLNRRLRAVGSLKNGWSGAIGKLAFAAKQIFSREGPGVKMGGRATPAQDGFKPEATFEYRETVGADGSNRHIDYRVVSALERAFDEEQSEMIRHIEEKMTDAMKEAGAM